jgi:hypothetical protein
LEVEMGHRKARELLKSCIIYSKFEKAVALLNEILGEEYKSKKKNM